MAIGPNEGIDMSPHCYALSRDHAKKAPRPPQKSQAEIMFNQKIINAHRSGTSLQQICYDFQMQSTLVHRILRESGDL